MQDRATSDPLDKRRVPDPDQGPVTRWQCAFSSDGNPVCQRTQPCMLGVPGKDEVSLGLFHRATGKPVNPGGLDHITLQVDDCRPSAANLVAAQLRPSEAALPWRTGRAEDPRGGRPRRIPIRA